MTRDVQRYDVWIMDEGRSDAQSVTLMEIVSVGPALAVIGRLVHPESEQERIKFICELMDMDRWDLDEGSGWQVPVEGGATVFAKRVI